MKTNLYTMIELIKGQGSSMILHNNNNNKPANEYSLVSFALYVDLMISIKPLYATCGQYFIPIWPTDSTHLTIYFVFSFYYYRIILGVLNRTGGPQA